MLQVNIFIPKQNPHIGEGFFMVNIEPKNLEFQY